jgi:hypothetical protein
LVIAEEHAMTPEQLIEQVEAAIPGRLRSAVLYGSAVAGDHVAGTSNYNVLLVVDPLGLAELNALSPPAVQWAKAGNRPPLLFTPGQLQATAHVFAIELFDIRQSHRILFGDDTLAEIAIEPEHLRLQVQRELKGKLLLLRERYLLTGGRPKDVANLLTSSIASFLVLFRAVLRLFQEDVPARKADALRQLAERIPFDAQPLLEIEALKHGHRKLRDVATQTLFESYLTTIERVADAVDRHLHPESGEVSP